MKLIDKLKLAYCWCQQHDKLAHFIGGSILSLTYIPLAISLSTGLAIGISFAICTTLFLGKEIFDVFKVKPTGFDINDLGAGYTGWSIGVFIIALIQIIILLI